MKATAKLFSLAATTTTTTATAAAAALIPVSEGLSQGWMAAAASLPHCSRGRRPTTRLNNRMIHNNKVSLDVAAAPDESASSSLSPAAAAPVLRSSTPPQQRRNKRNARAVVVSPPLALATATTKTPSSAPPPVSKKPRKKQSFPMTKADKSAVQHETAARTESFSACWAGTSICSSSSSLAIATRASAAAATGAAAVVVEPPPPPPTEPHTLILGTHPSVASLAEHQYYGHPLNAFWWIAGDCLGFRRDTGISPTTGQAYQFTSALRYNNNNTTDANSIPYDQQLDRLVTSGFALWDMIASCQRAGSLDQAIRDEVPNDVVGFCRAHPSVRRIILTNGGTAAQLFVKHFADWMATGQLVAAPEHAASQKAFGAAIKRLTNKKKNRDAAKSPLNVSWNEEGWTSSCQITLVCAISVSPAAARFTYTQKRDFWEEHVYRPGLALLLATTTTTMNDTTKGAAFPLPLCDDVDGDDDAEEVVTSPYFAK